MEHVERFTQQSRIAYFSMEIALRSDVPTYAGGLGVLAGDTVRSAADLEVPLVAVTLVSRNGYFKQQLDAEGRQTEMPQPWDPDKYATRLSAGVAVPIDGRDVWVSAWLYLVQGHTGGQVPVILLDTDLPFNAKEDRAITDRLYVADPIYRLKQEAVLGIAGCRMLRALGFSIRKYHMNEGHAALLSLELMHRFAYAAELVRPGEPGFDLPRVRNMCVFTTHTPVEAGHDKFPYETVSRVLGDYVDIRTLKGLSDTNALNMTKLALALSEYVNGVAERHAETSRRLFPGQVLHSITNGVHAYTWTGARFAALYDHWISGWRHEPLLLVRADRIPDEAIWTAHQEQKQALMDWIRTRTGVELRVDLPTIGFARRMTEYKRPDLLFADIDRLRRIARTRPFQMVLAGKAHPSDEPGKRLIALVHERLRGIRDDVAAVYLPDYDMDIAFRLVGGTDIWLNTPLKPLEASGTSGMKAAFNGVPSLSILDGWWVEGCLEGVNGWAIGDPTDAGSSQDHESLYHKLEDVVLPMYCENRPAWIAVMKGAISKSGSYFDSHRMMRRYVTEAYLR
jgi:glycogen phosphorylase